MHEKPTLCFFTVVMNRLHHLRQTLPQNLVHNTGTTTKFLILDYNSDDGLQEYIVNNFANELKEGRLEYHRYAHAKYFSHSHSRNLAVRIATADIVCNVDADNYTGPAFDAYLLHQFAEHPKLVVSGLSNPHNIYGAFGRMATRKADFLAVGGYDETFEGYGFEDYDIVGRLEKSGLHKVTIEDTAFLQSVSHDNLDRVAREWTNDQLKVLYRQQVNDTAQVLLYLFKDNTVHYGVVNEDFAAGVHYRYTLAGNSWQKGTWAVEGQTLRISFTGFDAYFDIQGPYLTGNNHRLKVEDDPLKLEEAILFHTNMANCCRYVQNKQNNLVRVNENGFGHGDTETMNPHLFTLKQ